MEQARAGVALVCPAQEERLAVLVVRLDSGRHDRASCRALHR